MPSAGVSAVPLVRVIIGDKPELLIVPAPVMPKRAIPPGAKEVVDENVAEVVDEFVSIAVC
jgi:hypothetical protein